MSIPPFQEFNGYINDITHFSMMVKSTANDITRGFHHEQDAALILAHLG